jgi:hemerythrin-like domain-containing protein
MNQNTTPAPAWPDQVTFPGQTQMAQGPHDLRAMYLAHYAFRRDLGRFETAVRETPTGDPATWHALAERWALFATVLHHHHTIEDEAIWPALLHRVADDPDAAALLHEMEAQHELIDPALDACADGFAAMAGHPCADHRNALDVHVTTARQLLVDHLRHEETEALPLVQRVMTADDWAAAEAFAGIGITPRQIVALVPWVLHGLSPELRAREVAASPLPFRLVLRLFGSHYDRKERRAFRYA